MQTSEQPRLDQNGYSTIVLPRDLKRRIDHLDSFWKEFCKQSSEEKSKFSFNSDGGYEYKNKEALDFKENFHVSMSYRINDMELTQVDRFFLQAAYDVLNEVAPLVHHIAGLISKESDCNFLSILGNRTLWSLRCLHYMPSDREVIAYPHVDKGPFTLHLRESVGGLEYFWKGKWHSLDFSNGETGYFPGLLGQYHSECLINGLSHRVVSTPESRKNGRFSLVLFLDTANPIQYNKAKFGPSQTCFEPGENYEMEFEQFKQYFVSTDDREVNL